MYDHFLALFTYIVEAIMMDKLSFVFVMLACCVWQTEAYNCSSAGRFADSEDTTCQQYYFCVYDSSTSSYTAYNYTCPTTSLFNPSTQVCTTNYTCSSTNATTTNSSTSSVCTADGYVADPDSSNCTTYIQCVLINETYSETTLTCPNDTYYNPNTTLCESDYNCTSSDSATFTCTSAGRFADSSDTSCQTYYLCVALSDGTFSAYTYTCPSTSVFDPDSKVCTTSYTCSTS